MRRNQRFWSSRWKRVVSAENRPSCRENLDLPSTAATGSRNVKPFPSAQSRLLSESVVLQRTNPDFFVKRQSPEVIETEPQVGHLPWTRAITSPRSFFVIVFAARRPHRQ